MNMGYSVGGGFGWESSRGRLDSERSGSAFRSTSALISMGGVCLLGWRSLCRIVCIY